MSQRGNKRTIQSNSSNRSKTLAAPSANFNPVQPPIIEGAMNTAQRGVHLASSGRPSSIRYDNNLLMLPEMMHPAGPAPRPAPLATWSAQSVSQTIERNARNNWDENTEGVDGVLEIARSLSLEDTPSLLAFIRNTGSLLDDPIDRTHNQLNFFATPTADATTNVRHSARIAHNLQHQLVSYPPPPPATPQQTINDSSFSQAQCRKFFKRYSNTGNGHSIAFRLNFYTGAGQMLADGIERFCKDLGVPVNDFSILYLSYLMNAKVMGLFEEAEFIKGMSKLKCDNLAKLKGLMPKIKTFIFDPEVVKDVWRFAFDFAKDQDKRCLEIETACQLIKMLLFNWSMVDEFVDFLKFPNRGGINRDQYFSILDFARTEDASYAQYTEYSAWPVLFDEFVEHIRKARKQKEDSDADK